MGQGWWENTCGGSDVGLCGDKPKERQRGDPEHRESRGWENTHYKSSLGNTVSNNSQLPQNKVFTEKRDKNRYTQRTAVFQPRYKLFLFSPKDCVNAFREKGREREKERKGERERNSDWLPFHMCPSQGSNLRPRHVP